MAIYGCKESTTDCHLYDEQNHIFIHEQFSMEIG